MSTCGSSPPSCGSTSNRTFVRCHVCSPGQGACRPGIVGTSGALRVVQAMAHLAQEALEEASAHSAPSDAHQWPPRSNPHQWCAPRPPMGPAPPGAFGGAADFEVAACCVEVGACWREGARRAKKDRRPPFGSNGLGFGSATNGSTVLGFGSVTNVSNGLRLCH